MQNENRISAQRKLDKELRFYRLAAQRKNCTPNLLRAVRQVLGFPVAEIARAVGISSPGVFELERSEGRGTIKLNSMERAAGAMGCKLIYAIVPLDGKTLEEVGEERRWAKKIKELGSVASS